MSYHEIMKSIVVKINKKRKLNERTAIYLRKIRSSSSDTHPIELFVLQTDAHPQHILPRATRATPAARRRTSTSHKSFCSEFGCSIEK